MPMDGTPIIIKKKKAVHGGSHGGSWKVAYADFVTAMMSFFLTLWIMGLSPSIKAKVAGYFNDPMGYTKTPPLSRNLADLHTEASPKPGESKAPGNQISTGNSDVMKEAAKVKGQAKYKALAAQTSVIAGKDGVRIEFFETRNRPFFQRGSADFTPDAQAYVEDVAKHIAPTVLKVRDAVTVEGYTDASKFSGAYDNNDLSAERALTLKHALQEGGFSGKCFSGVIAHGAHDLKDAVHPNAAVNRRVTIWIHAGGIPSKLKSVFDTDIRERLRPDAVELRPTEPDVKGES